MISVGQLDSTGYAAEFGKGLWKIVKGAMVVARGTKSGTLYTTAGCINMTAVTEGASGSCLWHNRLGHMSPKGMKMMVAKGALEGLKSVDMGIARAVLWENRKVRLEMVHTDVWDQLKYHHLEDPDSMLPSLMISAGRYGFTS